MKNCNLITDMYYVYVLKCNNNDLYVGYSENLKIRISQHTEGKVISTKSKRPVTLIYYEAYKHKEDATKREYQLKDNHKVKEELKNRVINSLN